MSEAMHDLLDRLADMLEDHHRGGLEASYTIVGDSDNGYDIILHVKQER